MELFSTLRHAELFVLAAHMERVVFSRPDINIITEGKQGNVMYLLEEGHPMVTVQGVGRVRELEEGDVFGELAILQSPYCWRTATVKTMDMRTVVWALSQEDVFRLIPVQRREETLAKCQQTYDKRAQLRKSELVAKEIDRFWDLLVEFTKATHESHNADGKKSHRPDFWRALQRTIGRGQITKDAYSQMHLRISKVLAPGPEFDVKEAMEVTRHDWAEDITAFAGDMSSSVYVELIKEELVRQGQKLVSQRGWMTLFSKYDADGGGTLNYEEFKLAVRNDMGIPTRDMVLLRDYEQHEASRKLATATAVAPAAGIAIFNLLGVANDASHRRGEQSSIDAMLMRDTIEDKQLKRLFKSADVDGGGDISAQEFAVFMSKQTKRDNEKRVLQQAAKTQVIKLGWETLFNEYDLDGGGELDFEEFETVIRKNCAIDADAVSDDNLHHVFDAIDKDGGGTIDIKEMMEFLQYNPFNKDMNYDAFAESLFQLASGWVENDELNELWGEGADEEAKYVRFLQYIWYRVTSNDALMPLQQVKMASMGGNGLDFTQLTAAETKKKRQPKPTLRKTVQKVLNVKNLSRTDEEVYKATWAQRAAAAEERKQRVIRLKAEAAHERLLRVEQAQKQMALAERVAARHQSTDGVYFEELPLQETTTSIFDAVVAASRGATSGYFGNIGKIAGDGRDEAATIRGGTVVGGICHGQGDGPRTAAVFNRVFIQPVAVHDPEATAKAKVKQQASRKAAGRAKVLAKKEKQKAQQTIRKYGPYESMPATKLAPKLQQPEPEPEPLLSSNDLDTAQQAYDKYTRMLEESAFWRAPQWLPAQQMAAAGIAKPYRLGGAPVSRQEVPMRAGVGGAGNRWVADTAAMQSGSDRACMLELAIDASPRGTPRSLECPLRFPSRTKLVKPDPAGRDAAAERAIVAQLPSVISSFLDECDAEGGELSSYDRTERAGADVDAEAEIVKALQHSGKPVGPAGFRSPRTLAVSVGPPYDGPWSPAAGVSSSRRRPIGGQGQGMRASMLGGVVAGYQGGPGGPNSPEELRPWPLSPGSPDGSRNVSRLLHAPSPPQTPRVATSPRLLHQQQPQEQQQQRNSPRASEPPTSPRCVAVLPSTRSHPVTYGFHPYLILSASDGY